MKQKLKNIMKVSAALALAVTTHAQQVPNPAADQPGGLYQRMGQERVELLRDTARASDVLGMEVATKQGEQLGKVHEVFVNLKSGRIVEVIVAATSGSLSAVPPQVLHHSANEKTLQLDASNEKFLAAPKFDKTMSDAVTESNLLAAVYVYYGEQAYFVADPEGLWTTNANGTPNRDGTRNTDQGRNAAIDRHLPDDSNTVPTRDADGKETGNYYSLQNRAINSWSSLGNVRKLSALMGLPVRNLQGVKLGKVHNFIVDLAAGRLAAVIISSHGVLGMGNDLSSVPVTSLQFDPARGDVQLDLTRDMLASAQFGVDEWPNFALANYTNGAYYPYKIVPFNNVTPAMAAGDSGREVRAHDNQMLAKVVQGSSQADQDLLSQIRQAITADASLSANAKHILIITADGRVTLRGPVNTSDERKQIGEIAARIATATKVDNELEVQITN